MKSYIMINDDDIMESYSISSGLDYPGIVPFHAYLHSINRVTYDSVTDFETIEAFKLLSKKESIIINLSGKVDKNLDTILNLKKYM